MAADSDDDLISLLAIIILAGTLAVGSALGGGGVASALNGSGEPAAGEGDGAVCVVSAVPSGDVLLCGAEGARLRLQLVDAPEPSYGPIAERARAALVELAPPGTRLLVELEGDAAHRYEQTWGFAVRETDGLMLNAALLEQGVAAYRPYDPESRHREGLQAVAQKAQGEREGSWVEPTFRCFAAGKSAADCGVGR